MNVTIRKRRFENQDITLGELIKARCHCAIIIKRSDKGEKLLPLFERLDKEIERRKKQELILAKALEIANDNEKICNTKCDT